MSDLHVAEQMHVEISRGIVSLHLLTHAVSLYRVKLQRQCHAIIA